MMRRAALLWLACGCASPTPLERALERSAPGLSARPVPQGLSLRCLPAEAEVALDGVLQGTCADLEGRLLALPDGPHRLEVSRPGYASWRGEIAPGHARAMLQVDLAPSR
jgi:hypothetical protein